ncbi:hypothetical protein TNCV_697331, partial [Trichonephila clavipes]
MIKQERRFVEMGPKRDLPLFPIFISELCLADESALLVEWLRQQTKLPHLRSEANPQR